jgi:arachidonate 15-lipoxygenase
MMIEPIVMATHRQLSASHPLHILLDPHFEGTLYINSLGQKTVFAPGGTIETISSATRDAFRGLAVSAVADFPLGATSLPANLKSRGVDDPNVLKDYPFRDDGLLIWGAINRWAAAYVRLYYGSDADVAGDTELQAWVTELLSPEGGRMKGVGESGGMSTLACLIETVTCIIFTSSAQHWALNGPLNTLMTYVPYYPMAAYQARPTSTSGATEKDYLNVLPPIEQAQRQFGAAYLMGSADYTTLGNYPRGHFSDERVRPLLTAFGAELDRAEATINQRNLSRSVPYPFMKPSVIPQSINI